MAAQKFSFSLLNRKGSYHVEITPDMADKILERCPANRRPKMAQVNYLIGIINRDEWRNDNPVPIVFDKDNNLSNGQHRLMACSIARAPIEVDIRTQVDPEVGKHIDTNYARGLFDRVQFLDDDRENRIASQIVNQQWLIDGGKPMGRISPNQAEKFWQEYITSITYIVKKAAETPKPDDAKWRRTPIMVALVEYHHKYAAKTRIFLNDLNDSNGTIPQARAFREFLFRYLHSGTYKGSKSLYLAATYALEAYVNGEEVTASELTKK